MIQILIIAGYFLITILIGISSKKNTTSSKDFHGAKLGILMCVAAGTGEWLGGTSTIGVCEYGYTFGLSGAWYTIANAIGVIVLALFFAKLYRSLDTITVPGIMGHFIGENARAVASIFLSLVMIAVGTAQLIAAGAAGVTILNINFTASVLILGTIFIIYTLAGGMNAVGKTNILHLITMYGGMLLALYFLLKDVGGITALKNSLPASKYFNWFSIGKPKIFSWLIASILGACAAQAGIQPLLAAKDIHVAKKAAFITAFVVMPFGIISALLGVIARVKFPDITNAKLALPALVINMNPVLGGIILAAIFAAILSTISPIILASGTMITKDIYQKKIKPRATEKEIFRMSRITTAFSGILCIISALLLYGGTRILDIIYFAYTIRGSLFVILLFGIIWKRTSQQAAIYTMFLTAFIGVLWIVCKSIYGQYPVHPYFTETYASVITATLSIFVLSLIFKRKEISLKERKML